MKRRTLLTQAGSIILLLGAPQLAWGASMIAVRMWPSEDYTRVTIESDTPLQTKHYILSGPDRFVVDIEGMQLNNKLLELMGLVQANDPFISAVRLGQYQPNVVRIVFDLKQQVAPNIFTLKPIEEYKDRLVFDFMPLDAPAPIEQLASDISTDRNEALHEGNQAKADILEEWLDEQKENTAGSKTKASEASSNQDQVATADNPNRKPTPSKIPADDNKTTATKTITTKTTTNQTTNKTPPNSPSTTKKGKRLRIIAIDPGHGGEDPGAVGKGKTREKDVVLAIGKILRDLINKQKDMRAYMTRDADFFVPLAQRVKKARNVKADLFISIHADAFTNRTAKGASVFALSEKGASSAAAGWLADSQNKSDLIGGVDVKARDKQTADVLLSMSTAAQIRDSIKLGQMVLQQLKTFAYLHKNSVEQAGFAVLKAPDIPSILVETAFISHPEEEKKLKSAAYQKKLAQAILKAIQTYIAQSPV